MLALGEASLLTGLLNADFDAVYGHHTYSTIRQIYMGPKWANEIDATLGCVFVAAYSFCSSRNHDEIR